MDDCSTQLWVVSLVYIFSSIGFAKAALECINGENMFGEQGASWSVIYVDIDAHNRNRTIFETILPRESNSKVCFNSFIYKLCPGVLHHMGKQSGKKICNTSLSQACRLIRPANLDFSGVKHLIIRLLIWIGCQTIPNSTPMNVCWCLSMCQPAEQTGQFLTLTF